MARHDKGPSVAAMVAILGLAASPAWAAKPMTVHVKAGATYDGVVADYGVCNKAFVEPATRPPNVPLYQSSVAAQAGAAAATGFIQGYMEAKARMAYVDTCMAALGYTKIDMTEEERAATKKAKGEAGKRAWFDTFFAQDFSARIEAVQALTPELPVMEVQPYGVGGIRLEATSLRAAAGPVSADSGDTSVLTGSATHLSTGALAVAMDLDVGMGAHLVAPAGAVFHLIDYGAGSSASPARGSAWCGPVEVKSMLVKKDGATCFINRPDGYMLSPSGNLKTWLAGPQGVTPGTLTIRSGGIAIKPSETDLIGPMTFAIKLMGVSAASASLQLVAGRGGESVNVVTLSVPFDANGQATLPLWGHRLVLTRSGDAVATVLTADGDGVGLISVVPT